MMHTCERKSGCIIKPVNQRETKNFIENKSKNEFEKREREKGMRRVCYI